MQCVKCGFENPPEAKFCGRCGETMKPPVPLPRNGGEAVPQGLKFGIIIGSIFIAPVGIIMGAIYMNDPNPEKKKVGRLWLYVGIGALALQCICGAIVGMIGNMNPNAFN